MVLTKTKRSTFMRLHIIATGSAGNAYLLEASTGESLLIECGTTIDRIKKGLGFSTRKLAGCILTHEHGDHAKAATAVLGMGIDLWASAGTHQALGTFDHYRARLLVVGHTSVVGAFKVKPFNIQHDALDPLGFLIWHPESGVTLFLTDSYYSQYKFDGLNNVIIEANYDLDIVNRRVHAGETERFLRDRIVTSHMSLATCVSILKANDLRAVNKIVLIHLSSGNSDEARWGLAVTAATGKSAVCARDGMIIENFNKTPF